MRGLEAAIQENEHLRSHITAMQTEMAALR